MPSNRTVHVLHVIPSVAPSTGGPAEALGRYVRAAQSFGVLSEVLTTDALGVDKPEWSDGIEISIEHAIPVLPRNVSPALLANLAARVRSFDCVHLHGNWQFHSVATALACRVARRPLVIRPCGGLSAIEWARAGKRLYLRLVEMHVFRTASLMHYTTHDERAESARLIGSRPSCVIPPPVRPEILDRFEARKSLGLAPGALVFLFIGRLDAIKRCDLLIQALARMESEATLVLAGPDWGVRAALETLVESLALTERVHFTGSLDRSSVQNWCAAADCFALASAHENFGLSVAEACVAGLPCVLPRHLPIAKDLGQACIAVDDNVEAFATAFESMSSHRRRVEVGQAAREHALAHWSDEVIGLQLRQMYDRAMSGPSHGTVRVNR